MKYMLLIYTDPSAFDPAQGDKIYGEYMAFTQEIVESGELVAGDPLQGIETATSVRVRDGKRTTTDGPFAETKDLDRAVELAGKIPDSRTGSVEVRPVMDMG